MGGRRRFALSSGMARIRWLATLVALALHVTTADGAVRVVVPAVGSALVETRVSTSMVETLLEQRGYLLIGKLRMTGGLYRVWALDAEGRKVELVIDPDSVRILRKIYPE